MTALTLDRLRAMLSYDPSTGQFVWIGVARNGGSRVARVAGSPDRKGHLRITIDGKKHGAHRLAWLYVHGVWPSQEIDHRNGIKTDNRIANLRDVSSMVNRENLRRAKSNSRTGLLGAFPYRDGRFTSQIRVRGVSVFLGYFGTAEQAHAAYVTAKRQFHEGSTL